MKIFKLAFGGLLNFKKHYPAQKKHLQISLQLGGAFLLNKNFFASQILFDNKLFTAKFIRCVVYVKGRSGKVLKCNRTVCNF